MLLQMIDNFLITYRFAALFFGVLSAVIRATDAKPGDRLSNAHDFNCNLSIRTPAFTKTDKNRNSAR